MLKVLRSSQITTVFSPYPGVNEVKVCRGGVQDRVHTYTQPCPFEFSEIS